ncbi:hypothetical protein CB0940_08954 [Cercospora beticola]|uniref:Uncharacterized protein n=1 Tax=Cercospora beticola TaxID=122368 RepID=A0A2G5HPE2_CERBT|nr:hypothetical protein CB0940_08954 [Cercospora beticola]PIA94427.1 hypothetical protein CB0940_08954 [Cercospora beticola]WPB05552.1 hypothetical protein RHO25_010205 [Cercospora beticola]
MVSTSAESDGLLKASAGREPQHAIPRRPLPGQPVLAREQDKAHHPSVGVRDLLLKRDAPSHSSRQSIEMEYWSSFWLRKTTLISFAALFVALAASLIILWLANRSQDGFQVSYIQNHYAWTYGPTAVMVIVVSLWRQVDYYCKILQPWKELQRGPATAERSLLLDYIGPINLATLIQALRSMRWPVFCSVAGFTLLKLMALLSTGLLVLSPVTTSHGVSVQMTNTFNASEMWRPFYDISSNFGATPVFQYLGILDGDVRAPKGTQDDFVHEIFTPAPNETFQSIAAEVDVFRAEFTCEIADIDFRKYQNGTSTRTAFLTTPSCATNELNLNSFPTCWDNSTKCEQTRTEFYLLHFNCSGTHNIEYSKDGIALIVSNVTYLPIAGNLDRYTKVRLDMKFGETAAILCQPGYSMNKAIVTTDSSQEAFTIQNLSRSGQLGNVTAYVVQEILLKTLYEAREDILSHLGELSTAGFVQVIAGESLGIGAVKLCRHSWRLPDSHQFSSQVGDSGAAVTLDMIQKGGATTAPLVWNDHVLPALGTEVTMSGELPAYVTGSSSFDYTFKINALRPYLECEPVSEENISTAVFADNSPQNFINISFPLKGLCQKGGRNGTNAYFEVSYSMILSKKREWTGKLLDLHLGPFFDRTVFTESSAYNVTEKMLEYGEPSWGPDNMMGCPSIGVIIGEFGKRRDQDITTALLCTQKVEEVQLSVTYHGNQTNTPALIGASAPRPKPGQSRFLANGTEGFDAFPYRVQTYIGVYDYGGGRGNLSAFSAGRGEFSDWIDSFADNIVNGPDGVPYEELRGKANQDNLIRATQKLYNKYITLVIDANFRQSLSNPQDHPIATGRLEVLSSRLHVNFVSKMILQVVLASMIIMGSFAFWLADLRETLPRKPTSIASTMAFLAGSDLCGSAGSPPLIPPNALQMNSAEVARVFDGWFPSLGWWSKSRKAGSNGLEGMMTDKQEEERRFGIDVGVPDQLGFRRRRNVFRRK